MSMLDSMYFCFLVEILNTILYGVRVCVENLFRTFVPKRGKSLKGQVIVVTGGSSGIGRALCHEIARREKDVTIVVWTTDEERNARVVEELRNLGVKRAEGLIVDVSDQGQVENAAKRVAEEVGMVTLLVNNAGISSDVGPLWSHDAGTVARVFDVNVLGSCWTLRAFLPAMLKNGGGHVVTTNSVYGLSFYHSGAPYFASKHALHALIECVKEDVRKFGGKSVAFTTVYPNVTETPLTEKSQIRAEKYPFLLPKYDARRVAERIVEGIAREEEFIYFPPAFRLVPAFVGMLPRKVLSRLVDVTGFEGHRAE